MLDETHAKLQADPAQDPGLPILYFIPLSEQPRCRPEATWLDVSRPRPDGSEHLAAHTSKPSPCDYGQRRRAHRRLRQSGCESGRCGSAGAEGEGDGIGRRELEELRRARLTDLPQVR